MSEDKEVGRHYVVLAESLVIGLDPDQLPKVARYREGKTQDDIEEALNLIEGGDVGGASYKELEGMIATALFQVVEIDPTEPIEDYRERVGKL